MVARRLVPLEEIDGILAALPPSFRWFDGGEVRMVAGPTGLFLVAPAGADGVPGTASRLARRAAATRDALAAELAWVPFVDALVVADSEASPGPATVVPAGLLHRVLTEGQPILDPATVERVERVAGVLSTAAPAEPRGLRRQPARWPLSRPSPAVP